GRSITETALVDEMTRESKYRPNMRVTLSADENLSYGTVSKVMGLLRRAGVTRMALSVKR
ncbi:MAG TPA: biopolymer transporter ExbD, partial [Spirochaetota bacterium]|nr:biopolymer transporter ExbD [Spirochaetota bacterium]